MNVLSGMAWWRNWRGQLARLVMMLPLLVAVGGCARLLDSVESVAEQVLTTNLITTSHLVAEQLLADPQSTLNPAAPILVATFVDAKQLEISAPFGLMIAEQIASRLVQLGFHTREIKLRNALLLNEEGEFMLSREVRQVSRQQHAQAVVTGTYAVGRQYVYVSARLIQADDNRILNAHDYRLPLSKEIKTLLKVTPKE